MELVRNFSNLNKGDAALAGGKGASLGEMSQAGIPVPPGFVVLSESFEQFIRETDLIQEIDAILHKVNHQEIHTVEAASEQIRALILNADMPKDIAAEIDRSFKELNTKYVAVRSSATAEDGMDHAWAGQLESYLNTTEDDLLTKVKLCWSSLFTPRAIFYRFEKGLHKTKISVAVVVQKMVESEISGIAFSVHPVTEDYNQLIIEAGFGLGEAIVSGSVTPDSYVVEKEPRNILDINVSTQDRALYRSEVTSAEHGNNEWRDIPEPNASSQVLTETQILELSEIILHIEKHYGFPCDIEWAFEGGKFYIVQSRPITTLQSKVETDKKKLSKTELSSFIKENELDNPNNWIEVGKWVQSPLSNTFFDLWHTTKVAKAIIPELDFHTVFMIDHYAFQYVKDRENIYEYLKKGYKENSLQDLTQRIDKKSCEVFTALKDELAHDDEYIKKNIDKVLDIYKEFAGVWSIDAYIGELPTELAKEVGYVSSEAELFAKVHPYLRDSWVEKETKDAVAIASKFIEKYPTAASTSILELLDQDPELQKDVDAYLKEYIWSKINKWIGEPIDKNHVYKRIQEEIQNIKQGNHVETKHSVVDESSLDGILQLSISTAYWRAECGRMEMETAYRLRNILKEVGAKNNIGYEQVLLLSSEELPRVIQDPQHIIPNKESVLKRQDGYFSTVSKDGEQIVLTDTDKDFNDIRDIYINRSINTDHGGVLGGIGSSPGYAIGPVRIVESPKDFELFKEGEILVADQTTPSFVPLMRMAAAIVTGKGGITSHAAIVSRELKKPCVIAVKDVNKILKTGDMVEVDADNGTVKILNKTSESNALILLGAWNVMPLEAWRWFDTKAVNKLEMITGTKIRVFTYVKDNLHYQCVFEKEVTELKNKLEARDDIAQIKYVQGLYNDYYQGAHSLENYLDTVENKDFSQFPKDQLIDYIQEFADLWTAITTQIWYAVFLDLWYPLPDQHKELKEIAAKARDHAGKLHERSNITEKKLYTESAKRINLVSEEVNFLFPKELINALSDDTSYQEEIKKRQQFCVTTSADENYQIYAGEKAKELYEQYKPPSIGIEATSNLKGVPACKGQVKGIIRIIKKDGEFELFKDGEILVTLQTMVHYLPIMKKASAILTEFGGLTSHAAIISRELNKPCIVGIPNLLVSLKDGDLVEVDADNGIVRIIK